MLLGGGGALSASDCNVEQAQGSRAACIMLSSFVTYDKRSRTGHKTQFFKTLFFCCPNYTQKVFAFRKSIALWKHPCVAFNVFMLHHFDGF